MGGGIERQLVDKFARRMESGFGGCLAGDLAGCIGGELKNV